MCQSEPTYKQWSTGAKDPLDNTADFYKLKPLVNWHINTFYTTAALQTLGEPLRKVLQQTPDGNNYVLKSEFVDYNEWGQLLKMRAGESGYTHTVPVNLTMKGRGSIVDQPVLRATAQTSATSPSTIYNTMQTLFKNLLKREYFNQFRTDINFRSVDNHSKDPRSNQHFHMSHTETWDTAQAKNQMFDTYCHIEQMCKPVIIRLTDHHLDMMNTAVTGIKMKIQIEYFCNISTVPPQQLQYWPTNRGRIPDQPATVTAEASRDVTKFTYTKPRISLANTSSDEILELHQIATLPDPSEILRFPPKKRKFIPGQFNRVKTSTNTNMDHDHDIAAQPQYMTQY